jgi:hypothetical protein
VLHLLLISTQRGPLRENPLLTQFTAAGAACGTVTALAGKGGSVALAPADVSARATGAAVHLLLIRFARAASRAGSNRCGAVSIRCRRAGERVTPRASPRSRRTREPRWQATRPEKARHQRQHDVSMDGAAVGGGVRCRTRRSCWSEAEGVCARRGAGARSWGAVQCRSHDSCGRHSMGGQVPPAQMVRLGVRQPRLRTTWSPSWSTTTPRGCGIAGAGCGISFRNIEMQEQPASLFQPDPPE